MSFRERVFSEIGQIDADIRRTRPEILFLITCLAVLLAASIAFGGLHL